MALEPEILNYIDGDSEVFERRPLQVLAKEKQLKAYMHEGFWQCMDTQRDKQQLETMIEQGQASWML